MSDNNYLDTSDSQTSLPQTNIGTPPNLLMRILGGAAAGASGTISPMQAYKMGMPQAAGMTMAQLQQLVQQPERQAQLAQLKQQTSQQAQLFPAQLADIQAQTAQRQAAANKPASGMGSITQNQQDALEYGVESGILAPQEITYRGPKTQILADGIAARSDFKQWQKVKQKTGVSPTANRFNPMQADVGLKGAASQASAKGKQTQQVGAAVSAMEGTLDLVQPIIQSMPDAKLRIANSAFRKGQNAVDDPQANKLLGYLVSLRGFYATMLHGGGVPDASNEKEAQRVISDGVGKQGFQGLNEFLRNEGQVRMRGVTQGYQSNKQNTKQSAPDKDWKGGTTHTYPDGTVAQWDGTKWVKVQ